MKKSIQTTLAISALLATSQATFNSTADLTSLETWSDLQGQHERGELEGDSDAFKTIQQLSNENGFKAEETQIITEDGYILSLWRIPGNLDEAPSDVKKPPILFVPSLTVDMMQWVWHKPDVAHAFVMSRAGYDVWLLNNRGCRFSQTHKTLTVKDKAYWQFSWEDMGTKDLPATIDHITKLTGFDKISYVGHSQGTTQLLAGGGVDPDYFNSKINIAVLLAPPMSMHNCPDDGIKSASEPFTTAALIAFADSVGFWNLSEYGSFSAGAASGACSVFDGILCKYFLNIFGGGDSKVDYYERLPTIMSNLPSGSGYKDFVHYAQLVHTEKEAFRRYDHGYFENQKRYGQHTPPDFDLAAITFPVAMFGGLHDIYANPTDVAWVHGQMKEKSVVYADLSLDFDHMTFAFARDMSFFTKDALAVVNHYNNKCDASTADSKFTVGNEKCAQAAAEAQKFLI